MVSDLADMIVSRPWFALFAPVTLLLATYLPLTDDRWAKDVYPYLRTPAGTLGWMALHWAWMPSATGIIVGVNKPLLSTLGSPLPDWAAFALWSAYTIFFLCVRVLALKFLRSRMERRIATLKMETLLENYTASWTEGDTRS